MTSSWTCPLTDVTQWMSWTETLSTHLGILPEAVTSALCCSSSLSAYLLILIPKLLSALICQRAFVFVCEFLVSNDPPTVLFCRHGTAHNGLVGTFAVCGRRESPDSPEFRPQRYPASWGLGISLKEVCCVGPITFWLTFSNEKGHTSWHGVDTDIWGFRAI